MAIRPISYGEGLTLREARERLDEIAQGFVALKKKYTKGSRGFQCCMDGNDLEQLSEYAGLLFLLGRQPAVQEEFETSGKPTETVYCKSRELAVEILDMMAD